MAIIIIIVLGWTVYYYYLCKGKDIYIMWNTNQQHANANGKEWCVTATTKNGKFEVEGVRKTKAAAVLLMMGRTTEISLW